MSRATLKDFKKKALSKTAVNKPLRRKRAGYSRKNKKAQSAKNANNAKTNK